MENRSNNVLVGSVVLILLAVTVVFTVWLAGFNGAHEKKYDILFKSSVSGLAKGSPVTFSGVPIGKVDDINIVNDSPDLVQVRISVKDSVPILQGTTATVAGVGFTGVSQINLDGAIKGAPPITEPGPFGEPVIPTKPGALGQLLDNAPELLNHISDLTEKLSDLLNPQNQQSITHILAHLDTLSGALADRGPDIAQTLAETRVAVQQAGDAAEKIGKLADTTNGVMQRDLQPTLANLNQTVASAKHAMGNLDAAVSDARPGLKAFSTRTIPEVGQLVRNLNEMADALTSVAGKLDRGGAGALVGGNHLPDYTPKK